MKLSATALVSRPSVQRACMPSRALSGRKTAVAISFCSSFNCARVPTGFSSGRGVLELLFDKSIRFQRLLVDFVEGRDAIVPFEQRGGFADEFDGVRIHSPNRV